EALEVLHRTRRLLDHDLDVEPLLGKTPECFADRLVVTPFTTGQEGHWLRRIWGRDARQSRCKQKGRKRQLLPCVLHRHALSTRPLLLRYYPDFPFWPR